MSPAQLLFNVHFQICLRDQIQRNLHATVSTVVKNHFIAFKSQQPAAKVALPVDGLASFQFRVIAREALVIGAFIKPTIDSGRRNFERVSRVNKIFDV